MISVIIITKNEERNIAACLESVQWADEIVVVDSGSTDKTAEIARGRGAQVFVNQWPGYGAQKNFAVEHASNEWILSVDADEIVTPELRDEIRAVVKASAGCAAFRIPRQLVFQGRFLRWGGCYPNYQLRLFRKGFARYNDALVHEKLIVNGAISRLKGSLLHYSYDDLADYIKRFNLYTSLIAREKFAKNTKFYLWHYFRFPLRFVKTYFIKLGFLDGQAGLDWALLSSFYDLVKYMKLKEQWESNKL